MFVVAMKLPIQLEDMKVKGCKELLTTPKKHRVSQVDQCVTKGIKSMKRYVLNRNVKGET